MCNKYYLYLEPFVYLECKESYVLIYNTLSGNYIEFDNKTISLLFNKIISSEYYGAYIDDSIFENIDFKRIAKWIKDTFSGDILFLNNEYHPVVLKPNFKFEITDIIYNKIIDLQIYFDNNCAHNCKFCGIYNKQFLFCKKNNSDNIIDKNKLMSFINKISSRRISSLSFIGGNIVDIIYDTKFISQLKFFKCEIYLYIHVRDVSDLDFLILERIGFKVIILVDESYSIKLLKDFDGKISIFNIDYVYHIVVEDECNIPSDLYSKVKLLPFYNGINDSFFRKNVFTDQDDMIQMKLSMRELYNKYYMNTYFFGRLIVDSDNSIYMTFNQNRVGNIDDFNIDILDKLFIENSNVWHLHRRVKPVCCSCIFQNICPPISDYELFMNRFNLCTIK